MAMNSANLIGRITKDIEVRKTGTGVSVVSFTLAVDRRLSNEQRQTEGVQTADYIPVVVWRNTADFLGKFAHKGSRIGVSGHIQTRSYQNANGQTVYATEVVAENIELLDPKHAGAGNNADQTHQPSGSPEETGDASLVDFSADDIPF